LAKPGGGLDRPLAILAEGCRPRQQPLGPAPIRDHLQPSDRPLVAVDRHRRLGRLVGVDTHDHRHQADL
jgi:hypothetical protein